MMIRRASSALFTRVLVFNRSTKATPGSSHGISLRRRFFYNHRGVEPPGVTVGSEKEVAGLKASVA